MGAAQCAFVTFGSWLEDDFGATAGGLAAVSFGLGLGELIASTGTVRLTDQWGKRRSVALGAAVMVPTGILMIGPGHGHLAIGLALLGLYILGFEFAVVSGLSLASNLVPGRPSTGHRIPLRRRHVGAGGDQRAGDEALRGVRGRRRVPARRRARRRVRHLAPRRHRHSRRGSASDEPELSEIKAKR